MQCDNEPIVGLQIVLGEHKITCARFYACLESPLHWKGFECVFVEVSYSIGDHICAVCSCRIVVSRDFFNTPTVKMTEGVRENSCAIR